MKDSKHWNYCLSHDTGLQAHWLKAFGALQHKSLVHIEDFFDIQPQSLSIVWLDTALPRLPSWSVSTWRDVFKNENWRIVCCSSNPSDAQGMAALDAGCVGYCHAFSDHTTLQQVEQVVASGQVWIGKNLMQRLLSSVKKATPQHSVKDEKWHEGLTAREIEVAILAANGASNAAIADQCIISERTVKAHLSAVFTKMNITDRLQLALRVHGIQ
jgi:DNA-binding NarL/FixJ family response regulator